MKVKIYQAELVVEGKGRVLTKSIAKQFPVRPLSTRHGHKGEVKEPLAKVRGEILGSAATWLYLVEDLEAGLSWEPAALYLEGHGAARELRGYNVDDPASVPTIIL